MTKRAQRAIYTCANCGAFILGAPSPNPIPCFACDGTMTTTPQPTYSPPPPQSVN